MEIILLIIVLVIFVGLISALELNVKANGPLFSGRPAPFMRFLAGIVGLASLLAFVYEQRFLDTSPILFLLLAILLIAYSLNMGQMLNRRYPYPMLRVDVYIPLAPPITTQILTFSMFIFYLSGVSILIGYAVVWVATHRDNPLTWVCVAAFMVMMILVFLFRFREFLDSTRLIDLIAWLQQRDPYD